MALHLWLLYVVASIGLSVTPGPNSLLALTHGARYGHARTLFTIAGGALGFILLIALSMLGIGTLLRASTQALIALKWIGGAYLIWLGVQLWRAPALHLTPVADAPARAGSCSPPGMLRSFSTPCSTSPAPGSPSMISASFANGAQPRPATLRYITPLAWKSPPVHLGRESQTLSGWQSLRPHYASASVPRSAITTPGVLPAMAVSLRGSATRRQVSPAISGSED